MKSERRSLLSLRHAGRLAVVLMIATGIILLAAHPAALAPETIEAAVARYPAAPLVFLCVQVIASLIFFPRTLLGIAAGALFGAWWGVGLVASGSLLGALAGFLVARYVNGGVVDLENAPRLGPVLSRAESGGWRAVAALRLVPVVPHSLANYALGLTRIDLASYALGSLLGQLPMTIASVQLGAAGENALSGRAGWLLPTAIGAAALALSFILPRLVADHR